MDVILKEGIDLLNEIGAKQSTSEEIKALMQQGVTANVVKSIQHGSVTIASGSADVTATISAVNTTKSFIYVTWASDSNRGGDGIAASFKSGTEILLNKNKTTNSNGYVVNYSVIEFY